MLGDEVEVSIRAGSDTVLSNPQDNQVLTYSATNAKWVNSQPTGSATWDEITNKPPQIQYAYYTTSWPARPAADTVIWVGGNETTPPSAPEVGKDIWIRDAEVV